MYPGGFGVGTRHSAGQNSRQQTQTIKKQISMTQGRTELDQELIYKIKPGNDTTGVRHKHRAQNMKPKPNTNHRTGTRHRNKTTQTNETLWQHFSYLFVLSCQALRLHGPA